MKDNIKKLYNNFIIKLNNLAIYWLNKKFTIQSSSYYPLLLPSLNLNLCIGLNLKPVWLHLGYRSRRLICSIIDRIPT